MSKLERELNARKDELRRQIDQTQKDLERERREYRRERRMLAYYDRKKELEDELARLERGEVSVANGFADEQREKISRLESLWRQFGLGKDT